MINQSEDAEPTVETWVDWVVTCKVAADPAEVQDKVEVPAQVGQVDQEVLEKDQVVRTLEDPEDLVDPADQADQEDQEDPVIPGGQDFHRKVYHLVMQVMLMVAYGWLLHLGNQADR